MVRIKRIYDELSESDGTRVLVDRLWPRGISKERAHISEWVKEIAPSDSLTKSYAHEKEHWDDFHKLYKDELSDSEKQSALKRLSKLGHEGTLTLLYAARDEAHNNAVVLKEYLDALVSD